jgi:uncharacterized protein DUF5658
MRVSRETVIIAGLCCADLVSTLVFVRGYGAIEANVVMEYYLRRGLIIFTGAKCLFFVPALVMAEWCRLRNPRLITRTLRLVIGLYVGLYSVGVFALNRPQRVWQPDHLRPQDKIDLHLRIQGRGRLDPTGQFGSSAELLLGEAGRKPGATRGDRVRPRYRLDSTARG